MTDPTPLKKADTAWRNALGDLQIHLTLVEKLRHEKNAAENAYAQAFNRLSDLRLRAVEAVEKWGQVMREEAQDEISRLLRDGTG